VQGRYRDREMLIRRLVSEGCLRSQRVIEVMRKVPRHEFVPDDVCKSAYIDAPQPIGCNQTISAPHMVAIMTELLDVNANSNVLEIGTGSGYQAAILAELAKEGRVVSVERIKTLADRTRGLLQRLGFGNVIVVEGDGTIGCPDYSPFDRIIVTAAAPDVPPALIAQLSKGGRMLVPVGGRWSQTLLEVGKDMGGGVQARPHGGCVFVPLIGHAGWSA